MSRNRSIKDYENLEVIGRGGFATVYKARDKRTNKYVAVKRISIYSKEGERKSFVKRIQEEVRIHSLLSSTSHSSILPLYDCFEDESYVYLILQLCQNGNLQQLIAQRINGKLDEWEAKRFLVQIVDGMLLFQNHGIMHRDLKLTNILLDNENNVKIADFGMATQVMTPKETHTTMCGTPNYISPEVAGRKSYGLETDVWSFGIILYEMVVGDAPFAKEVNKRIEKNSKEDCRAILGRVTQGTYKIPISLSDYCRDLIEKCLCEDVEKRIKLQAIPEHPFLRQNFYDMRNHKMSVDSGNYTQSTSGMNTRYTRNTSKDITTKSNISNCSSQSYKSPSPLHFQSYGMEGHNRNGSAYNRCQDTNPLSSLPKLIQPPPLINGINMKSQPVSSDKNCAIKAKHPIEYSYGNPLDTGRPVSQVVYDNPRHPEARISPHPSYQSSGHGGSYRPESPNPDKEHKCKMKHRISQCDCVNSEIAAQTYNPENYYISSTRSNCSSKQMSVNNPEDFYIASTRSNCSNSSKHNYPTLRSECAPLSTARLKPLRHTKNTAIVQIFPSGETCVEFLSKDQKVVCNVFRISSDGNDITFYNTNVRVSEHPPPIPPTYSKYTFDTLPEVHWKKYKFAARFVDLVKARTPRITYQTELAKCRLMENGPPAKFEAKFHTGESVVIYKSEVHVFINKRETVYQIELCPGSLKDKEKPFFLHADMIYKKCLMYNKLEEESEKPYFPIRIGTRHVEKDQNDQENKLPKPQWSSTQYGIDPCEGRERGHSRRPLSVLNDTNSQRINFEIFPQTDGEMVIKYSDGSRLKLDPQLSKDFCYSTAPSEPWMVISQNNVTPSIRDKLQGVRKEIEKYKDKSKYSI